MVDPEGRAAVIIRIAAQLAKVLARFGRKVVAKAWNAAKPHVKKAINKTKQYKIVWRPSRTRIFAIKHKKSGKHVFAIDYHRYKGKMTLHYHRPPNMKKHYILWQKK